MSNVNLVERRKAAFRWLKVVLGMPESLPDEITTMADALGGQFGLKDNLKGLRDGTSNPTSQLIDALRNKSMVGELIPETEIEDKLITPFESSC